VSAGERSRALGFPPQVTPVDGAAALFQLTPSRDAIHAPFDGPALADLAMSAPERFSPNVLLRPLVQDWMFPNVAYVAGPGELAYHGQLGDLYKAFGVPRPLLYPRASVTIMDAPALRFLDRYQLPLAALRQPGEGSLNALIASTLPPETREALDAAAEALRSQWAPLAAALARTDQSLEGAARAALGRLNLELETLQWKGLRAVKRREGDMRRQFAHAQARAFPHGAPQERVLGVAYFANQYGPALADRLVADLPVEMGSHWVVAI
jgi:uncharacterized protein YllA (UPF0747 family)